MDFYSLIGTIYGIVIIGPYVLLNSIIGRFCIRQYRINEPWLYTMAIDKVFEKFNMEAMEFIDNTDGMNILIRLLKLTAYIFRFFSYDNLISEFKKCYNG